MLGWGRWEGLCGIVVKWRVRIRVVGTVHWREWELSAGWVYERGDGEVCVVAGADRGVLCMFWRVRRQLW